MIRALLRDARGVTLIEFALGLPVVLLVGLGGLEVAHFGIACLRVSQIAMTTADNAARVRNQISEADVNEVMAGARFVGRGIGFAEHGRIILSSLEPRTDTSGSGMPQWIRWQRCSGVKGSAPGYGVPRTTGGAVIADATEAFKSDGTASANPSSQARSTPTNGLVATPDSMGTDANRIAAIPGTAIMFVEVRYDYVPLVGADWISEQEIGAVRAYNVRQRTDQVLKTGGVAYADRSRCNKFTA